jgi:hypothetical protein
MRAYIFITMIVTLIGILYATRNSKIYQRVLYFLFTTILFAYATSIMLSFCQSENIYQCFI